MSASVLSTQFPIAAGLDEMAPVPLPVDERPPMPFRPENRMTTFLVLAVLLLCGMAVMGVRVIMRFPSANSTPAWVFLGTSVVLALKILLAMLQTEFATRKLSSEMSHTRHDLRNAMDDTTRIVQGAVVEMSQKTNGGLTKAIHESGEQVRKAERDQLIDNPECFKALTAVAEKAAEEAANRAAQRVLDALKGGGGK